MELEGADLSGGMLRAIIASSGIAPGRSTFARPPCVETIVDSIPCTQDPPSITAFIRPDKSAITWDVSVGLTFPERFAEGAATGPANALSRRMATGSDGTLTPSVGYPLDAWGESPESDWIGRTRVSGPGQNSDANSDASGSDSTHFIALSASAKWIINGLCSGRPLAV